ncbi:hypothetical protein Pcinc_029824 [Petrolisthes cinctipes]|uniref:Uncharacterized protein n=1 Tax=Petrolisthes cinctipes TaxID=88211 RepID=A0AAE1F044_PETCI|nr:hypothetical protein Pcinc_029824 [Petrolisthes cinctipes]
MPAFNMSEKKACIAIATDTPVKRKKKWYKKKCKACQHHQSFTYMTANTTNTSPLPTPPVLHLIQHHQSFTYKTANTTNISPSNTHHSRQDVVTAHKPSENHIT